MVLNALLASIVLELIACFCGLAKGRAALKLVYGLSFAAATVAAIATGAFLVADDGELRTVLPIGLPWLGAHLRLDPLAGFFGLIVNLIAAIVSIFALGYAAHDAEPERALPAYPMFLVAMNLVLLADDAYVFLVSWEFMSLSSWLLVLANHRQEGTSRAAFVYLVMASIGTTALLLAFGLLAGADGAYTFAAIRASAHPVTLTTIVAALVLVGAGSKAGLVPLHAWLPLAHPAAPSHVSALAQRRHDQGRDLRHGPRLLRPRRRGRNGGGRRAAGDRRGDGAARHPLCDHAARPQDAARLFDDREHRDRRRRWDSRSPSRPTGCSASRPSR